VEWGWGRSSALKKKYFLRLVRQGLLSDIKVCRYVVLISLPLIH
jgi:hypothetical protein